MRTSAESADITAAVRTMYKRVGLDPTKTRPSSEALLRRVRKGDALPRINSLVDVINWCSLETQLPFGLYDLDRISGSVTLRLGASGEAYAGIRKDDGARRGPPDAGRRRRPVRQSDVGFRAHDGDARDDARARRHLRAGAARRATASSAPSRSRANASAVLPVRVVTRTELSPNVTQPAPIRTRRPVVLER